MINWQAIIATLAVIASVAWLGRRAWIFFRKALTGGRVGDCGHCPRSVGSSGTTTLVRLGRNQIAASRGATDVKIGAGRAQREVQDDSKAER